MDFKKKVNLKNNNKLLQIRKLHKIYRKNKKFKIKIFKIKKKN